MIRRPKRIFRSNWLRDDPPSLCAYCRAPAKGYLVEIDKQYFGACSMNHQDKIREGERLPNVARVSMKGIEYALTKLKARYQEIAKENNTFVIHNWQREDRVDLFNFFTREYLNYANKQCEEGVYGGTEEQTNNNKRITK